MKFDGSPYDLLQPMEEAFRNVFLYKLSDDRLLLAALDDVRLVTEDGPLYPSDLGDALNAAQAAADATADADAPFVGDVVFALAYDLHWALRPPGLPGPPPRAAPTGPLGVLARVGTVLVYDRAERTVRGYGAQAPAALAIARGCHRSSAREPAIDAPLTTVSSGLDSGRYAEQLDTAKRYFDKGDIYQAVISVKVRARPHASPYAYFKTVALRYAAATYSYWLSVGDLRFFGNCSLPHVTLSGRRVSTRVFAGTVRSGDDKGAEIRRLREDPKYFSEHVMLVDLERNDIGRLARPGRVWVDHLLEPVVIGPTTYLATDVHGELDDRVRLGAVVLSSLPRGVVVGAPKLRAAEIVAEIEGRPRGFYSGALGLYQAGTGEMVSNTVVTCGQVNGDTIDFHCAGGVTNESTAAQELSELVLKLTYLL